MDLPNVPVSLPPVLPGPNDTGTSAPSDPPTSPPTTPPPPSTTTDAPPVTTSNPTSPPVTTTDPPPPVTTPPTTHDPPATTTDPRPPTTTSSGPDRPDPTKDTTAPPPPTTEPKPPTTTDGSKPTTKAPPPSKTVMTSSGVPVITVTSSGDRVLTITSTSYTVFPTTVRGDDETTKEPSSNKSGIIGGVVGAVAFVAVIGLMGLFILKRRKRRQSTFFKTTPENGGGDPDHMFYPTETMTDNHSLTMPMQNIPKARPLVAPLAPTGGEEEMGLYGGGGGYAQQPSGVHGYPAPTHGVYGNPSFSSSGNMAHYASPYAEQVAPPAYLHRHVPNEIDYSEPHPLPQPGYTNIVHKPDTPPSQAF